MHALRGKRCWRATAAVASVLLLAGAAIAQWQPSAAQRARPNGAVGTHRMRPAEKPALIRDAYLEDNAFVVRISNNNTANMCNGVLIDDQFVLSDVTCIKYQNVANLEPSLVHVSVGDPYNESKFEVEQIYLNKVDPLDKSTELALLKLKKPVPRSNGAFSRTLEKPEHNFTIGPDAPVQVVGFTQSGEFKQSRTRISTKNPPNSRAFLCTLPGDLNDTPGTSMMRGAPLLQMTTCDKYKIIGVLRSLEVVSDAAPLPKKHQDCYIQIANQIRWIDQVKMLSSFDAKHDGKRPGVVEITIDDVDDQLRKYEAAAVAKMQ